ncbi:MAG: cyclic nucleotide-binding domain-containing protein [Desulfobacteraceae bacterium]|nr:MAG: cyclic nucleotide-binding domain-containing protein [Desulfobacteraceae bacterium]
MDDLAKTDPSFALTGIGKAGGQMDASAGVAMRESEFLIPSGDLLGKIRNVPTLSGFRSEDLKILIRYSKVRLYEPEERIIEEGGRDTWLFFMIHGKVKIVKNGTELAVLDKAGDIFGEMGMIEHSARSASAYAVEETVCLAFNAADVDTLTGKNRLAFGYVLYRLFSQCLATRLRLTTEKLIEAAGAGAAIPY